MATATWVRDELDSRGIEYQELHHHDVFTAQELLGRKGTVDRVDIVVRPGSSRQALAPEIRRRLPPGLSLDSPGRAAETADRMVRAFRFNCCTGRRYQESR